MRKLRSSPTEHRHSAFKFYRLEIENGKKMIFQFTQWVAELNYNFNLIVHSLQLSVVCWQERGEWKMNNVLLLISYKYRFKPRRRDTHSLVYNKCYVYTLQTAARACLSLSPTFFSLRSFKHLQLCSHQSTSSLITHFAVCDCTRHQQTPNETTRDFEESSERMRVKKIWKTQFNSFNCMSSAMMGSFSFFLL